MIAFTVTGTPQPKQRTRGANRYLPSPTAIYQDIVAGTAAVHVRPHERIGKAHRVAVTLRMYGAAKGDVDNIAKAVLDGMNKVVYADDSQVDELHVYRWRHDPKPRVEVEVKRIPDPDLVQIAKNLEDSKGGA